MTKSPANPHLEGLVDLACRDGVDIRPTLLRVLTDLYVQKPTHTDEEEAQYVELAQRLLDTVDAPTRAAVKARLAAYPNTPRGLVGLNTPAPVMSEPVEVEPASLAAYVPAKTYAPVGPVAPGFAAASELSDLFFAATTVERRLILTNLDFVTPAAQSGTAANNAEALRQLENAALSHNTNAFAQALEKCLGINRALAKRIAEDRTGEPIVVAAKALAMPAAVVQRILLFINPSVGQSVQRVYDLALLYDEITPQAAQRMVSIWRQAEPKARGAHQPVYHDDERARARRVASPAQYHFDDRSFEEMPPPFKIGAR